MAIFEARNAIFFVVDSSDRERERLLSEEQFKKSCPLLVFANKQDLPNALTVDQVPSPGGSHETSMQPTDRLGLRSLNDRPWYI